MTKTLEDIRIKRKFWRQNPFSILQKDPHRTDLSDNRKPSFIIGKKAWSVVGELSGRANVHTPPEPLDRLPKSPSPQHDMDRVREGSMSQTQMLKFKQKNDDLLEELNARTLAVNRAIDVLNDVSDLHLQMSSHLQIQNEISSTIHDDSWKTTEIIVSANVYLERAKKNFQSARLWKVLVPIIASVALLLIDRR